MGSGVDPSMTLHALLVNRDICFLLRFLKQQIIHLAPLLDAGSRSATIRLGSATGGRVEAAAARRGRTCWIASVYSCAAGNCWAMLPVGSPKRPVWDTGTLRNRTMSVSLCQPDTARGGAPGPQVWTSHDPETVP